MVDPLTHELAHHQYLRERLQADFPDADEETLQDTLEGLSNLTEMLSAVVRSQLDDQALVSALKIRVADMRERLERLDTRAGKKRELITSVMERAEIKKVTEPDFTLSLRRTPPPLVMTDEKEIPERFWRPQDPKLDRAGLILALKGGQQIPGASLGNGGIAISVRTK